MGDSDNGNETDTCTEEQSIEDVDDEADATEDPNSSDVELGWLFVRFFFFFQKFCNKCYTVFYWLAYDEILQCFKKQTLKITVKSVWAICFVISFYKPNAEI